MLKVKTDSYVKLWQTAVPDMEALEEITDRLSPNDRHIFEPDASKLEVGPIFGGRVCYLSFGSRAGRKTAEDYLGHINEVGHSSIFEHTFASIFIDGVSRNFSHELVRHRMISPSQLSQRFVAPEDLTFVVPPLYRDKPEEIEAMRPVWARIAFEYKRRLARETPDMTFAEKKKIREAARGILPGEVETMMVLSANLRAWREMIQKRAVAAADEEIHGVALKIYEILYPLAPHIMEGALDG